MSVGTYFHLGVLERIKKKLLIEEFIFLEKIFDIHFQSDIFIRKAVELDEITTVEKLIKNGANVQIYDGILLQIAIYNSNHEMVKFLLDYISPDVFNGFPMHLACIKNNLAIVELLQIKGAKIDIEKSIMSATQKGNLKIARFLMEEYKLQKLIPEIIMEAIKFGQINFLNVFLNELNDECLYTAIQYGHLNVMNCFIDKKFYFATKFYHYAFALKKFTILDRMIKYSNPFFTKIVNESSRDHCNKKVYNSRLYIMDETGKCHLYNPINFICQICKKECLNIVYEQPGKDF